MTNKNATGAGMTMSLALGLLLLALLPACHSPSRSSETSTTPSSRGVVKGRVILHGTPPPEKIISMDAACARLRPGQVTTQHYVVGAGGGLANAFVYVKKNAPRGPLPAAPVLAMRGCLFEPYVLGAQAGQPIELRNEDSISDNVHVMTRQPGNRDRSLAALPNHPTKFSFDAPELFIRVKTDVHPWMFAYICVVDHLWFAVTDANGNFSLPPGLPPGRYTLAAAHPKAGEQEIEINVTEGRFDLVEFTLNAP